MPMGSGLEVERDEGDLDALIQEGGGAAHLFEV
jgi:hypothetical protein